MKATEQHFPVVLFIMLYKVVLTLESMNAIIQNDHSNEFKALQMHFLMVLFVF